MGDEVELKVLCHTKPEPEILSDKSYDHVMIPPLPALVCTTTAAVTAVTGYSIINAPHGDDDLIDSPQLCIVPATLVSGDSDGVDTAGVPFQSTLFILSQVNYFISFSDRRLFFFRF